VSYFQDRFFLETATDATVNAFSVSILKW